MAQQIVRILFLLLLSLPGIAQVDRAKMLDSAEKIAAIKDISDGARWIHEAWRFNPNDDPAFAKTEFNDSNWILTRSSLTEMDLERIKFKGFGWFRRKLKLEPQELNVPQVIYINHKGASEFYLDGKLIKSFGKVAKNPEQEQRVDPEMEAIYLPSKASGEYQIAIRYSNTQWENSYNSSGVIIGGFEMFLTTAENYYIQKVKNLLSKTNYFLSLFVFFFTVGLLHLLLFIFYPVRRSNLFFAIFCFLFSYYFFYAYAVDLYIDKIDTQTIFNLSLVLSFPLFFISFQSVLYSLFDGKFPKQFKFYFIFAVLASLSFLIGASIGFLTTIILIVTVAVDSIIFIVKINKEKRKGANFITFGFGGFILFLTFSVVKIFTTGSIKLSGGDVSDDVLFVLFAIGLISIPLSMSAYLAWDFSLTSKVLSKKLLEVEELSAQTIEQEREKQKILSGQNEMLDSQVKERTKEINEQKKVIEEKNKDITDSINYAQRIQRSILPTEHEINDIFEECFVLFKPRDIVSGDFYQFKKNGDHNYAILADCTGHGVPGALMSMIGSNLLKQIILERGIIEPNKILSELHKEVRSTLRQTGGVQSHDGMDASVVLLHNKKLFIASANRPVYIVVNGELTELKPDKRSIGGSQSTDEIAFTLNEIEVQTGMMVYLFSDGYADQFGGEAGKKFKVKNLSQLLLSIYSKPLNTQKEILNTTFDNWKQQLEQVDDVSLIGIRF